MTSRQLPRRPRRQRWSIAAFTGVTATTALSGGTTCRVLPWQGRAELAAREYRLVVSR